jgi:hypothetical protein
VHIYERQVSLKINSNPHPRQTFAGLLQRIRNVEGEPFPNFEKSQNWFNIKILVKRGHTTVI